MGPACHPLCTIKILFLDFFTPDFWSLALTLLAHGSHMSASMNNKPFLCWIYCLPLISGYLPFSFDPHRPLKMLRNLLAHGTRMSSSMYYKISFLGFFSPLIFGYFLFLLIPCRLGNVE